MHASEVALLKYMEESGAVLTVKVDQMTGETKFTAEHLGMEFSAQTPHLLFEAWVGEPSVFTKLVPPMRLEKVHAPV